MRNSAELKFNDKPMPPVNPERQQRYDEAVKFANLVLKSLPLIKRWILRTNIYNGTYSWEDFDIARFMAQKHTLEPRKTWDEIVEKHQYRLKSKK